MLRRSLAQRMVPKVEHFSSGVCKLTLDNPKSLNAVDHETVQVMRKILFDRLNNKTNESAFLIRGAGPKAFCSGGDVVSVATQKPAGVRHKFFYTEYQCNHAIGELVEAGIPYVALWNGIVMGGGFGISIPGSHRVCCPKTLFAMPETAIGLFPDVGGSWTLPRLPFDGLGLYLALSGARLKGADVMHAGLGTHYVSSVELLDKIEGQLLAVNPSFLDCAGQQEKKSPIPCVDRVIDAVSSEFDKEAVPPFSLEPHLPKIAKYFGRHHESVKSIVKGLEEDSAGDKWVSDTLAKLRNDSPTSVAVSFLAHQRGAQFKTRAEMFEMEYRLSQSMANHNDFYAGVDALLISKHKTPKWAPATLEDLDYDAVEKLFEKREPQQPTWDTRTPEEEAFKYLN